jgi:hypothetical protein
MDEGFDDAPADEEPAPQQVNLGGTLEPGDSVTARRAKSTGGVKLSTADRSKISARLKHLCRLLTRLRQPLAPINGILNLLPLDLVTGEKIPTTETQQALRGDLDTIRATLRLRCGAITLVTGMEAEVGFTELMARIGPEDAGRRFGKGCEPGIALVDGHASAVAANACAAFERYAHRLFKEPKGYNKYGNPLLYALVCRIRTEVRDGLVDILEYAYGHKDSLSDSSDNTPFLAGYYFAGTGDQEDRQAFVHGVFDRLHDLQDALQWTHDARREERFYESLSHVGLLLNAGFAVALVFLLLGALRK